MLKFTKKLFKHIHNTLKRDKAIDISAPFDNNDFTYELPAVPVQQRKAKKRNKTKAARKARRKQR